MADRGNFKELLQQTGLLGSVAHVQNFSNGEITEDFTRVEVYKEAFDKPIFSAEDDCDGNAFRHACEFLREQLEQPRPHVYSDVEHKIQNIQSTLNKEGKHLTLRYTPRGWTCEIGDPLWNVYFNADESAFITLSALIASVEKWMTDRAI